MKLLKIDNLNINNQYNLSLVIEENTFWTFFARDNEILNNLFLKISGINYSNNVYYYDKLAYDNDIYFKNRVYFCFKNFFFKSIFPDVICQEVKNNYNLIINQEKLEKLIDDLWIRLECEIKSECHFTPVGNTLINFSFINAVKNPILIINNPTINLVSKKHIDYITHNLFSLSNNKTILLGLNNLVHFKEKIRKVVIFTDYNSTVILDTKKDIISLISGEARGILNIIEQRNRLFFTYKNDIFQLLFVNNLSKEQVKELTKLNCKIQKISFFDIQKYM